MIVPDLIGLYLFFVVGARAIWQQNQPIKCRTCNMATRADQCSKSVQCATDEHACFVKIDLNGKMEAGCSHHDHCYHGRGPNEQCCRRGDDCNLQLMQNAEKGLWGPVVVNTPKPPEVVKPHFNLETGLHCHVCSGGQCGVADETVMKCTDSFPYCMNTILNDQNGNKYITKRCASFNECYATKSMERYTNSSEICKHYDGAEIYTRNFECSYCCETSLCNKNIVPSVNTRI